MVNARQDRSVGLSPEERGDIEVIDVPSPPKQVSAFGFRSALAFLARFSLRLFDIVDEIGGARGAVGHDAHRHVAGDLAAHRLAPPGGDLALDQRRGAADDVDAQVGDAGREDDLGPVGAAGSYARLPTSDLKLDGAYWSLRGVAGLKPLVHMAWRQPISGPGQTPPVYLASGPGAAELEGTLEVSVSRFLHVNLDLLLRRTSPAGPSRPPALVAADGSGLPRYPVSSPEGYRYRMQAHRRMRSGEVHYIDHPLMGVLLRIDRYGGGGG